MKGYGSREWIKDEVSVYLCVVCSIRLMIEEGDIDMCRALVFEKCLRSYVTQRENIRCDVYSARWIKERGIYMCSAHIIHKGWIFGAKD